MSSSSMPATIAKIRAFPLARTSPSIERPEVSAPSDRVLASPDEKKRSLRPYLLPSVGAVLLVLLVWYGLHYLLVGRFMISTDDAYVQADMAYVSPKISGYVASVAVTGNQRVSAGDPLLIVDDGDYKIAVAQADAQIATLGKTLERMDAQIEAGRASLRQAEAQKAAAQAAAINAARGADRTAQLLKTRVATQAQLDDARTAVDQANAALLGADAQITAARTNIAVLQAQRDETASSLTTLQLNKQKAERDLSFTVLRAPYDGVVGNLSVEQGDLVSPGQKLAAIVPMDKLYIVANFKETQLRRIVPGQKVHVAVDAFDEHDFEGTVSSLAPASGAVFSLLPPENATGNFTKVVQRVPVRIEVPRDALESGRLRAGLSVVVDVDSRTTPAGSN